MAREECLIAAYLLDGKGGGKKIHWDDIDSWTPEKGILWVHLNYTSHKTHQWLNSKSGLDKITANAMAREDSRPRTITSNNGLLVFLRGVNLNPDENPEDMVSIRIWINENTIITTRKRKLLSVGDIRHKIEDGAGPKTPAEFLQMLNDIMAFRMTDVIESLIDKVDALEHEIIKKESHILRAEIAKLRRKTIVIRRYLAPQREALNRLFVEETPFMPLSEKMHIRETADRIMRYIEDLDAARERAAITQEELSSRLSEELDKRIYLLSVVAIIFMPLTFLTGLLGVNVGGIPGQHDNWGFFVVCSILTIVMVVMIFLFYKKEWL